MKTNEENPFVFVKIYNPIFIEAVGATLEKYFPVVESRIGRNYL